MVQSVVEFLALDKKNKLLWLVGRKKETYKYFQHPILKSLNSEISVLHDFNVGKSVLNSQNLLAGSTAVLLETLF